MSTPCLTVVMAGSTNYTTQCAAELAHSQVCKVTGVITPHPRIVGRDKLSTANPLHQWANEHRIPIVPLEHNIDADAHVTISKLPRPDFLLVADFGYLVPQWLLDWPLVMPVNVHPSLLPRWRGSSPGQFVILYGETQSSVTVMQMSALFDAGPLLTQLPLKVEPSWTTQDYYDQAYDLIAPRLPELLSQAATHQLLPILQPSISPTPTARKLCREDGFIGWGTVSQMLTGELSPDEAPIADLSALLLETQAELGDLYLVVNNAVRAFSPWPGVWTLVPTAKGEKRMKILSSHITALPKLVLDSVQLEGQQPATFASLQPILNC